jgi:hypothetical protein
MAIKDIDKCIWCDQTFGAHSGVYCPSPFEKHRFVQQGTLTLGDFSNGTKLEYNGNTCSIVGTIICVHHDSVLMGWVYGQDNIPSYACPAVHNKLIQPPYTHGASVSKDLKVKRVISTTATPALVAQQHIQPAGMKCAIPSCQTYCDYAEPNQADGTFICYPCRKRPSYMR